MIVDNKKFIYNLSIIRNNNVTEVVYKLIFLESKFLSSNVYSQNHFNQLEDVFIIQKFFIYQKIKPT